MFWCVGFSFPFLGGESHRCGKLSDRFHNGHLPLFSFGKAQTRGVGNGERRLTRSPEQGAQVLLCPNPVFAGISPSTRTLRNSRVPRFSGKLGCGFHDSSRGLGVWLLVEEAACPNLEKTPESSAPKLVCLYV